MDAGIVLCAEVETGGRRRKVWTVGPLVYITDQAFLVLKLNVEPLRAEEAEMEMRQHQQLHRTQIEETYTSRGDPVKPVVVGVRLLFLRILLIVADPLLASLLFNLPTR